MKGNTTIDSVITELKKLPYQDLEFAKIDTHRTLRKGAPEVIFGINKTPDQITSIALNILESDDRVLITRTNKDTFTFLKNKIHDATFNELGKYIIVDRKPKKKLIPGITVVTAGTGDIPIALEAIATCKLMGCSANQITDVGVAGIHRLFDKLQELFESKVIITIAGMDGVLPSVITGLVDVPVICVPTSIGYGSHFGGLTPLLTMLNNCSPGSAVVNIDNGFGAGYIASKINTKSKNTS